MYAVTLDRMHRVVYTSGIFAFRLSEILGSLVDSSQVAIFQTLIFACEFHLAHFVATPMGSFDFWLSQYLECSRPPDC